MTRLNGKATPAKRRLRGPKVEGGSRDAKQLAAIILEVLAGYRTPTDAATALGISLPRYYQLESRALEGLVKACEPRRKGKHQSPERTIAKLQDEIAKLERAQTRSQALLRLSQRAIGVSAAKPTKAPKAAKGSKRKRTRKPVARALVAAKRLEADSLPLLEGGADAKTP